MSDRAPKSRSEEPDDDMHDPRDRGAAFPLGDFLRVCDPHAGREQCDPCLRSDYERADTHSESGQSRHLTLVRSSVTFGFLALFWGLLQQLVVRADPTPGKWWPEAVFTFFAFVLVLVTLLLETQRTWLVERYKAEALRLVKFRMLIRPALWNGDAADLRSVQNELEARRAKIANTPHEILEALAHTDELPDLPPTKQCERVDAKALARLLDYYRRKRLDSQLAYFEKKMREKPGLLENTLLQPLFFFFGIGLSMVVLLLESPWVHFEKKPLIQWLVFWSVALPFGWGAIRTLRGANERARNQARSHARYDALAEIRRSLDAATGGPSEAWDRAMIFGYLYVCESILASDQHEWLRLMKEAEAYG